MDYIMEVYFCTTKTSFNDMADSALLEKEKEEESNHVSTNTSSKNAPQKSKKVKKKKERTQELEMTAHLVELSELVALLETDLKTGLTSGKAQKHLERDGPNALTPPNQTPVWVKFLRQFFGGYFCFPCYKKSSKPRRRLNPQEICVLRDGLKLTIEAEKCVVGDIVFIKGGDPIPADIRIIESQDFTVDVSSLTGEFEPQERTTECTSENPLDTKNLVFFTTYAVEGTATGIVFETGDSTVGGRIANLATTL